MGIVFRVHDVELNRIVALKMMVASPFADQNARERFRGEAEAAARLDHPGIVPVFDVGHQSSAHASAAAS
jgi:serine/threonine protein kinase